MATVAVMLLTLFVFEGLIIFRVVTDSAINILKEKIDISVYFKNTAPEDDILKIQRSLQDLAEVKSVGYTSKDQALEKFRERHKNDTTITEAISVLDGNPLSASLDIKAHNPKDYPVIAAYLNNQNLQDVVEQVTYNQNQVAINRLANMVDVAQRSGVALTVILAVVAILVTLNTIILNIYSTRDEIGIMRVVGASNAFIRGPYIIQGVLYGIIAAVFSMLLVMPVISVAAPYVKTLMDGMNLSAYFYGNLLKLFSYQMLFGVVLGVVSSFIAVRKYLKD
ncbi:MAG: cell division transport system permease protein [Parcubacteria group bacterium Athens0714_26]|nr:MAG: cell division transport system permease protein [Parcubacteria group bacterium Athens1014_26]TSD03797.1 MAG: cell division transport system permease protein [Parcubacteria group bacterium Athens0714_26]